MLYRFIEAQRAELQVHKRFIIRPKDPSTVNTAKEAERWRLHCIHDITKYIFKINDESLLPDSQTRVINDYINKLIKEKEAWQRRIIELGGTDYFKKAQTLDADGSEVVGSKGYKYFGKAKELPGVREVLEEEKSLFKVKPETLVKSVDVDYYGMRDEDDGVLLEYERQMEKLNKA